MNQNYAVSFLHKIPVIGDFSELREFQANYVRSNYTIKICATPKAYKIFK